MVPPRVGATLVIIGTGPARGLATVLSVTDDAVKFEVPSARLWWTLSHPLLASNTREIMSSDEARAMVARLEAPSAPDLQHSSPRHVASIRALTRGTWPEIVDRLRQLYASPWKLEFGDRKMISMFEGVLLPELALVLKTERETLAERIHRHHPVFTATAARPPDGRWEHVGMPEKLPRIAGLRPLGTADFSGTVLIGERVDWFELSDRGIVRLDVKPGQWHSYLADNGKDGAARWLVLLHASAVGDWPMKMQKTATVIPQPSMRLQLAVVDTESIGNTDVVDAMRHLQGTSVYYRKAVTAASEELPKAVPVSISGPADAPTAIVIPLNQKATKGLPKAR